jgi:cytochrome c-type biogenesis protein CcmE
LSLDRLKVRRYGFVAMTTSRIDRELERMVSGSGGGSKGSQDAVPAAPPASRGNLVLLVVLLVMAGGIVALVMTSFKDAAVYAKSVDQVQAARAQLMGRRLRVEGNLVHGSLERRDEPCEYRFVIKGKEAELPVRYAQCVVPDTFRDVPEMDVGVTVEGKLAAGNGFEANLVLAKCPSKYEMKERKDRGEQMPHAATPAMLSGDQNSVATQPN